MNVLRAVRFFLLISCAFLLWQTAAQAALPMKVIYGFDREFPPFSFEEAKGQPVGFDVDIIKAVLQGQNVKLIMRPLSWDRVQVELSSGNIHVTTGMAKTANRQLLYKFSDKPTFPVQVKLFTKAANRVGNITLLRGRTVAVEKGSFYQRVLEEFGGLNIKLYKSKVDALKALHRDEVIAYGGPVQTAYYYINRFKFGNIAAVGTPVKVTDYFMAFHRDQKKLREMVNRGMLRILHDGEYDRIYRKWFVDELDNEERQKLVQSAKNAAINAYAPYTKTPIGAAVLTKSGKTFTGCNVENADMTLSTSAIRSALMNAVSSGEYEFRAVVAVKPDGSILAPSAGDRQFLFEFGRGIVVAVEPDKGLVEWRMISQMLPMPNTRRPDSYQY